jgi:hypothetical protein
VLAALAAAPRTAGDAFRAAHHDVEDPVFLGDAVFATYLARLASAAEPALRAEDGAPIEAPRGPEAAFWKRRLVVTEFGRALLAGHGDWVATNGLDRWLGGVRLTGRRTRWRWDDEKRRLIEE